MYESFPTPVKDQVDPYVLDPATTAMIEHGNKCRKNGVHPDVLSEEKMDDAMGTPWDNRQDPLEYNQENHSGIDDAELYRKRIEELEDKSRGGPLTQEEANEITNYYRCT